MSLLNSQLYTLFDIEPQAIIDFLRRLLIAYACPDAPDILDIGCGPGRLLQPLSAIGQQITGIEPDPDYYAAASQLTVQHPNIQVHQGSFTSIETVSGYHLALAVNNPFAYLLHLQERQDALSRLYRALRPGGVLLLDMIHFPWFLKHYRPAQEAILTAPDGAMIRRVIQHHFDWHENILTHTDIFYRNGQLLTTRSHRMAMIDPRTLRDLLEQAGFCEIHTYNSFGSHQPERLRGGRMILTAQKPHNATKL